MEGFRELPTKDYAYSKKVYIDTCMEGERKYLNQKNPDQGPKVDPARKPSKTP
jgi:hypothetical protein